METVVLVAHYAGAGAALDVARRWPERVDALVLVAPAVAQPRGGSPLLQRMFVHPVADRLGPVLMRLTPGVLERGLRQAWSEPDALPAEVLTGYRLPLRARHWDQGLWEVVRARLVSDHEPSLAPPGVPTLVVTGNRDRIVSSDASRQVALELGAPLKVMEDVGHLPHEEEPESFVGILVDFLKDRGILP